MYIIQYKQEGAWWDAKYHSFTRLHQAIAYVQRMLLVEKEELRIVERLDDIVSWVMPKEETDVQGAK